jgi:flagellar hook assembly protein FlgD
MGGLTFAFSKDLFPDFYIGAGLGFEFGSDWGLGLDLGFIHLPGDIGFLQDFRWGIAFRNIGKAYVYPASSTTLGWPPAFTPAVGAHFSLVNTDMLNLSFDADLSFPTFQDIRSNIGVEFSVADIFSIGAGWVFDLRQFLGTEPSRGLPFTFGASLKLKTDASFLDSTQQALSRSEVDVSAAAVPLENGIWGFGLGGNISLGSVDKNPPTITIDTEGEKYISPNFDGVKDDLQLALSIMDERYVKGYRFVVQDSSGASVRIILNKEDRPENQDLNNLITRLFYVKTGIAIPDSIRWDGKGDDGAVVKDGSYTYFIEAWDDNGNTGKSGTGTVIVDNTPPSISLSAAYAIFSPDADGNKDTLPLQQKGSKEDKWTGSALTVTGDSVKTFTWENLEPPGFEWDGKTDQNVLAPDGVYSYHVTATDRAGNIGTADITNIIIDTQKKPIQLAIDLSYISPNGDGIKDTVTFTLNVPVTTGIESWNLAVSDSTGAAKRTIEGRLSIPATVAWDGKDNEGKILPEGAYNAKLSIIYVSGSKPTADSPPITIDLTTPSAATKAEYAVFSPNGDGNRDTVTVFQDTSDELFWTGTFKNAAGKDVKIVVWRGKADTKLVWDGKGDDGSLMPDGVYSYILTSTDRGGNAATAAPISLAIDTEATPVLVSTDLAAFSPNGDGSKDKIRVIPSLRVKTGVDSYTFRIKDARGAIVRTFTGKNKAPDEVAWDGIDDAGKRAPDGQYTAELEVVYVNGNKPKAETSAFFIDTHYPQIDVTAEYILFSPDGDGRLDTLSIRQSSSDEELWEGQIKNAKGEVVRSWFWKGKAADVTWDGRDENGNSVPDGLYAYTVKAQSRGGNSTIKELRNIQIDTRPTTAYITASATGFSPNGDGVKDSISFSLIAPLKDGVKAWKVSMVNAASGVQKEFTGQTTVPASISWDGKNAAGSQLAAEGSYTAVLQVEYFKGNIAEARTASFRFDVTPPKVDIGIGPLPFSPDNDGSNDELTITLKVDDISPIDSWDLTILDPAGHPFNKFSGKGVPSQQIIWNGTSSTGELVQSAEDYPLVFTIKDDLGDSATFNKVIPVDILVMLDGNQLKVRIASITFLANAADYVNVDPEKALKNSVTIKRLAEIFKKYSQYKIVIQGHANLINYADPAKAKTEQEQELIPLSKARADAIRTALIAEGIDAARISTVGVGASQPVVPFSDKDNNWKNRRVEFILVRQ